METINQVCESRAIELGKEIPMNSIKRSHNSVFLPYQDSAVNKTQNTKLTANNSSLAHDVNVKKKLN